MGWNRVVVGILGSVQDAGSNAKRWERWRPTVGVCQQPDLLVDRFVLLVEGPHQALGEQVAQDIVAVSPSTRVDQVPVVFTDPWDLEEVWRVLYDTVAALDLESEDLDLYVHITTGTHVQQICWFLLAEARHLPARLLQSMPSPEGRKVEPAGRIAVIDLDLERYDAIAERYADARRDAVQRLKDGIPTRNATFNRLMAELEHVAVHSDAPILLTGPTGVGKTRLARRVYELKRERRQLSGPYVELNCATLRGDGAMSALFGHVKGAFTGALQAREGLLARADGGLLFLDEIGELGADEQAMLLRAIEDRRFLPMGADTEVESAFQLIAGTNRDLRADVQRGAFRDDLLARINLWTFELPGLAQRLEDLEPNLDFELDRFSVRTGRRVRMNSQARTAYLAFGGSPEARWLGNFRDLNASVVRMATLAPSGRIGTETVEHELERLRRDWRGAPAEVGSPVDLTACRAVLAGVMAPEDLEALDRIELVQLADVVTVCRRCRTLGEAGRELYQASRTRRRTVNDSDRVRKLLLRYGLSFEAL